MSLAWHPWTLYASLASRAVQGPSKCPADRRPKHRLFVKGSDAEAGVGSHEAGSGESFQRSGRRNRYAELRNEAVLNAIAQMKREVHEQLGSHAVSMRRELMAMREEMSGKRPNCSSSPELSHALWDGPSADARADSSSREASRARARAAGLDEGGYVGSSHTAATAPYGRSGPVGTSCWNAEPTAGARWGNDTCVCVRVSAEPPHTSQLEA